jgi:hypothetical protein
LIIVADPFDALQAESRRRYLWRFARCFGGQFN